MLRVFVLATVLGLLGAILGAVLANGTNLFREVRQNTVLVPLVTACTLAIIGAIAGAVDAITVAIDRQTEHRKDG
jgi:hypothetical protein